MSKRQDQATNVLEGVAEKTYTVVKRNGALVPFRKDRIYRALEAAFRDTRKVGDEGHLPEEIREGVEEVTNLVVKQVLSLAEKGACLTVEGIQDMVEVTLMKLSYHDIARDYIIYRDQHKALREDSPQNLKIRRQDESFVRFNPMKIASSVEAAFRSTEHTEGPSSQNIVDSVNNITQKVVSRAIANAKAGLELDIALIQDEIEQQLMREGYFRVAKEYILARAARGEPTSSELQALPQEEKQARSFVITKQDGKTGKLTEKALRVKIEHACRGLDDLVSVGTLLEMTIANFYEGIKENEIDQAMIFAARAQIEAEPSYSQVAARLLLDVLYREAMNTQASSPSLESAHRAYFKEYLKHAVKIERVHPNLLQFDLNKLSAAMQMQRDDLFSYLGLQTLYDRYFIHDNLRRMETPQIFWMRVAMGLAINEGEKKNERAIEFYDLLSKFLYVSSTPTLFNSGTLHPQLSSCYLSTVMDDLNHIFKVISDDAQLSKWAGGIGNDWTNVRATGSRIKGTNGSSQGVIPFLKVANDTAVAVNQCFAPETSIYTAHGVKPISEIEVGDLVLGVSGTYREVEEKYVYNQKDAMIALTIQHSLGPIAVTAGHPFFTIRAIPSEQSVEQAINSLDEGKIQCEWVEAADLQAGDYIAQVIPKEIVPVEGIEEEDMRFYGILLGNGHLSKESSQWTISKNLKCDKSLRFVQRYLEQRGVHFWETRQDGSHLQIHWAASHEAARCATTGRTTSDCTPAFLFEHSDVYDAKRRKHISPRFAHLPKPQTLALVQGLIETNASVSCGKEITFTNSSQILVEGLRYQLLRLGAPTAGQLRVRKHNRSGNRFDQLKTFLNEEGSVYDLRIPAIPEIAKRVGCKSLTKPHWLTVGGHVFTRVEKKDPIQTSPFVFDLKVEGDESYMTTAGLAHNGGKRKGAMCAYLETWHLDIEDFLELRKNTGDERRRTHDMNTANWIPDLFMKRVNEGGLWTLFSPADCPDLHDLYGSAFELRYVEYEKMADEGKIKLFKRVEAMQLWRKMLSMLFETGHPWITFKDPSNIRSPQDHVGVVHSSNLCTEILLNTSAEETAVCNLGSVNLALHMTPKGLDEEKLASTIRTAVRMLDNVIDINYYPIIEAKTANLLHRPIGLGLMGFQDALYMQGISYASHEAVEFADTSMEMISYYAILSSSELARERGTYSTYQGSKWSRGLLPIDTLDLLAKERGGNLDVDRTTRLDWSVVRDSIKKYGMRNSNTMAIAPTATISNITNVTQSIEPMYKHLFVKSNLSGEFTIPNLYLVDHLKKLNLWDNQMLDDLKYFDGSISEIERIPEETKRLFLTAFEIEPEWLIECASRRQKWIDMGQSLNLYLGAPSGKKLHQMYFFSWTKGLKTNYYLRCLAATQIEKSTTDINKRGLQPRWMKSESASAKIKVEREDKKPKACSLEEGCESCQ